MIIIKELHQLKVREFFPIFLHELYYNFKHSKMPNTIRSSEMTRNILNFDIFSKCFSTISVLSDFKPFYIRSFISLISTNT